jgi:hypothetical protein
VTTVQNPPAAIARVGDCGNLQLENSRMHSKILRNSHSYSTLFNSICASQPTRATRDSRRSSSGQPWWRYTHRGHGYPVPDLTEDATIRARRTFLERQTSRTDTALLLTTKWHVVVKNVVLIDPDLSVLVSSVVLERAKHISQSQPPEQMTPGDTVLGQLS